MICTIPQNNKRVTEIRKSETDDANADSFIPKFLELDISLHGILGFFFTFF